MVSKAASKITRRPGGLPAFPFLSAWLAYKRTATKRFCGQTRYSHRYLGSVWLQTGLIGLFLFVIGGSVHAASIAIPVFNKTGLGADYKICMLGYSKMKDSVPTYRLDSSGNFVQVTADQTNLTSFVATNIPQLPLAINSARVYYYIVYTKDPNYKDCSDISYDIAVGGDLTFHLKTDAQGIPVPLPNSGLFEFTLDSSGIHADVSNVDNIQAPINAAFYDANNRLMGQFGQPVDSDNVNNLVNQQDIIKGYTGWIAAQPDPRNIGLSKFSVLADTSGQGMINGPYAFIKTKGVLKTANGNFPNAFVHIDNPLNDFFDNELNTLFSTQNLKLTGDQIGNPTVVFPKQNYTLIKTDATCPWTLVSHPAAQFIGDDQKTTLTICNPVGMTYLSLPSSPGGAQTPIRVSQKSFDNTTGIYVFSVTPQPTTDIKAGMYFGQPDTGFSGEVKGISGSDVSVQAPKVGGNYLSPNLSYPTWMFTKIKPASNGQTLDNFESSGAMVFGGDGAFNDGLAQSSDPNMQQLLASVERNINEALNRGVANCNNVTMAMAAPPAVCKTMAGGTDTAQLWGTESNWYPAGGVQNYYAQFLHTYQLGGRNISLVPNGQFLNPPGCQSQVAVQKSNQGIAMGMNYGFAYDENPNYVGGCIANVPSKWDPAPPTTKINITLGPWPAAKVPTGTLTAAVAGPNVTLTIGLAANDYDGVLAEWYLLAVTGDGVLWWYSADTNAWSQAADISGLKPAYTGPLQNYSGTVTVPNAPKGTSIFIAGVDTTMSGGSINIDTVYYATAVATVP